MYDTELNTAQEQRHTIHYNYTGNTKSSLNYRQHENNTAPQSHSQSNNSATLTNTAATVYRTIYTPHKYYTTMDLRLQYTIQYTQNKLK